MIRAEVAAELEAEVVTEALGVAVGAPHHADVVLLLLLPLLHHHRHLLQGHMPQLLLLHRQSRLLFQILKSLFLPFLYYPSFLLIMLLLSTCG